MTLTRTRVRVEGIVQGVGFRPFVHALAGRLGLAGLVGNDVGGVFVEVEGAADTVERFLEALAAEAPPLAVPPPATTACGSWPTRPTGASTPSRCAARPAGRPWPCSTVRAGGRWGAAGRGRGPAAGGGGGGRQGPTSTAPGRSARSTRWRRPCWPAPAA